MRLMVVALALSLTLAVTASVFAIWPVVADAPWEEEASPVVAEDSAGDSLSERCQVALDLREAVIDAGITRVGSSRDRDAPRSVGGGRLPQDEYDRQLANAEREIDRYC